MGVGNLIEFVKLIVRSYFRLLILLSNMLYANQTYIYVLWRDSIQK